MPVTDSLNVTTIRVEVEVVYAPGEVVKLAVGAVLSTVTPAAIIPT